MTTAEMVAQAAEKYQRDGYEVDPPADPASVPAEFRDRPFQAAFVARKGGRKVWVEIWARDRILDVGWFPPSGWDMDTILMPAPDSEEVFTGPEPSAESARRLLAELERELPLNAKTARLLLAWSAVEAAARTRARLLGINPRGLTPLGLLRDLVSDGDLTDQILTRLRELRQLRNEVAHGSPVDPVADADIDFLAATARELLTAEPARAAG